MNPEHSKPPGPELDVDVQVEIVAPPPVGSPVDFRERLTLALKTTDPVALAAAERDYKGVWPSEHAYLADMIAEHLPPFLAWLPLVADPERMREAYQGKALRVWSIPLDPGKALIFESYTDEYKAAALAALDLPDSEPESPCPICGSRSWSLMRWSEDLELQGCDKCSARR